MCLGTVLDRVLEGISDVEVEEAALLESPALAMAWGGGGLRFGTGLLERPVVRVGVGGAILVFDCVMEELK